MFIAVLFTIAKTWKHPKCPLMDEWIRKCDIYIYKCVCVCVCVCVYIYIYMYTMEYYLSIKKNEILTSATTGVKLEGIIQSKIIQRK